MSITSSNLVDYSVEYVYTGLTNSGVQYGPSSTAPTQAGNYEVTATIIDNDGNYTDLVVTDDFEITRATLVPTATANNKNYDGTTDATGTITLSGAKYTDVPTATGTFTFTSSDSNSNTPQTVTVDVELDDEWTANYELNPTTVTTQATINKVAGVLDNIVMDDYTYGDTPSTPQVTSSTNDVTNAEFTYTGTTANGTPYGPTSVPPTDAGEYQVTVEILGNDNYNDVTGTTNFKIEPRVVTPVVTISDKEYDGTTSATIGTQGLTGVINNDDVILVIH